MKKLLSNIHNFFGGNNLYSLGLSVFATIGFMSILITATGNTSLFSNPIFLSFVPLIFYVVKQSLNKLDYRVFGFSVALALISAFIFILGGQLERTGNINWSFDTVTYILMAVLFFFTLFYNVFLFFNRLPETTNTSDEPKLLKWIIFGFILFFGILGWLALYPGVYAYDSPYQITQFIVPDFPIHLGLSVIHSFIMASIVKLGYVLYSSYNIGFSIYTFLQMTFLCFVTTRVCLYVYRQTGNKAFLIAVVLFFSLFPSHILMSVSSSQDAVFAGLFALLIIESIELGKNPRSFFRDWGKSVQFVILLFLLCVIRGNGFYLLIVAFPFFFILLKRFRWRILVCFCIPLILFQIYHWSVNQALNNTENTTYTQALNISNHSELNIFEQTSWTLREMSNIPCQQLFRVYCRNQETLSNIQKMKIEMFFPNADFKIYEVEPSTSDYMKLQLDSQLLKSDPLEFLKLYVSVGIKNPRTYLEAFLMNTLALWYPSKQYYDSRMYHPYMEYESVAKLYHGIFINIETLSFFPAYDSFFEKIIGNNGWLCIPFAAILFAPGSYFMLFMFVFIMSMYKKRSAQFVPLSLVLGLYITLFLAPVSLFRYVYPVVISAPLLVAMLFSEKETEKNIIN